MLRRTFVATVPATALLLAGCLDETVEEQYTETIEPENYVAIPFTLDEQSTVSIEVEVTDGEAVDVFVFESDDLNRWIDGHDVNVFEHQINVREASADLTLGAGEYELAVDNIRNTVPATVDAELVLEPT